MEVIHHFHTTYPFGNPKQAQHTYLEVVKQQADASKMGALRSNYKALKDSHSNHLMRVVRLLKEDEYLHALYDYYPISYYTYLESMASKQSVMSKQMRKSLKMDFQRAINDVMEALIKLQLKTEIYIFNIGVTSLNPPCIIKVFIDADCERETNPSVLKEYYDNEAERIKIELEEEYDRVFGVLEEEEKPNFIISGTKLVFLNTVNTSKSREEQGSREKEQHSKQQEIIKNKHIDFIEKCRRIEGQEEEQKKKELSYCKIQRAQIISRERDFIQKSQQLQRIVKELKSPHFLEPDFKPEEFTKDNTYTQEQTKYLESLQDQISKLNTQNRIIAQKRMEKRETFAEKNNILPQSPFLHQNPTESQTKEEDHTRTGLGQTGVALKKIANEQPVKSNKYIMKITTSHEIQIEGNQKDIEKDIMEQIKNGKLTLNTPQHLQVNQCIMAEKFGDKGEEGKLEGRRTEGKLSEYRQEPKRSEVEERNEYLNKVKEARSKAEIILKEYGKNKKQ